MGYARGKAERRAAAGTGSSPLIEILGPLIAPDTETGLPRPYAVVTKGRRRGHEAPEKEDTVRRSSFMFVAMLAVALAVPSAASAAVSPTPAAQPAPKLVPTSIGVKGGYEHDLSNTTGTAAITGRLATRVKAANGRWTYVPLTGRVYLRKWVGGRTVWASTDSTIATGGAFTLTAAAKGRYRVWYAGDGTHGGSTSPEFVALAVIDVTNIALTPGSADASGNVPVQLSFDMIAPAGTFTVTSPGVLEAVLWSSDSSSFPDIGFSRAQAMALHPLVAAPSRPQLECLFMQPLTSVRSLSFGCSIRKERADKYFGANLFVFAPDEFTKSVSFTRSLGTLETAPTP
jgi:hypothetical protein